MLKYSTDEATARLKAWCDRRDRCTSEVRNKILSWGGSSDEVTDLVTSLKEQSYLDDLRYAQSFSSGHFRIKKWGRIKIRTHLIHKNITHHTIDTALEVIDENEYMEIARDLAIGKMDHWTKLSDFERKGKVVRFLLGRGFENEIAWQVVNEFLPNN